MWCYIYSYRLLRSMVVGKIRQWFRTWFDRQIEKSFQRKANRQFDKAKIEYRDWRDGDNT